MQVHPLFQICLNLSSRERFLCADITGEKLVNFMVEPKKGVKWPKNLEKFYSRQSAITVCKELCKQQFLLRSEKRAKGELDVSSRDCWLFQYFQFCRVLHISSLESKRRSLMSETLTRQATLHGSMRGTRQ